MRSRLAAHQHPGKGARKRPSPRSAGNRGMAPARHPGNLNATRITLVPVCNRGMLLALKIKRSLLARYNMKIILSILALAVCHAVAGDPSLEALEDPSEQTKYAERY